MALAPKPHASPSSHTPPVFDLKSASLTLTTLLLRTADLDLLETAMRQRFGAEAGLFDDEALLLDLAPLAGGVATLDLTRLVVLLRRQGLRPLAVRGGDAEQVRQAGLLALPDSATPLQLPPPPPPVEPMEPQEAAPPPAEAVDAPPPPAAAPPTLLIDRPLRSGQQVYARGGDLVVMAPVSFGAEVIADGHIHVYAPLRGRAIAGARGDSAARIFSTCMEPQLVAVAGTYRTIEAALPADVAGRPAQVRLAAGQLVIEPLSR